MQSNDAKFVQLYSTINNNERQNNNLDIEDLNYNFNQSEKVKEIRRPGRPKNTDQKIKITGPKKSTSQKQLDAMQKARDAKVLKREGKLQKKDENKELEIYEEKPIETIVNPITSRPRSYSNISTLSSISDLPSESKMEKSEMKSMMREFGLSGMRSDFGLSDTESENETNSQNSNDSKFDENLELRLNKPFEKFAGTISLESVGDIDEDDDDSNKLNQPGFQIQLKNDNFSQPAILQQVKNDELSQPGFNIKIPSIKEIPPENINQDSSVENILTKNMTKEQLIFVLHEKKIKFGILDGLISLREKLEDNDIDSFNFRKQIQTTQPPIIQNEDSKLNIVPVVPPKINPIPVAPPIIKNIIPVVPLKINPIPVAQPTTKTIYVSTMNNTQLQKVLNDNKIEYDRNASNPELRELLKGKKINSAQF